MTAPRVPDLLVTWGHDGKATITLTPPAPDWILRGVPWREVQLFLNAMVDSLAQDPNDTRDEKVREFDQLASVAEAKRVLEAFFKQGKASLPKKRFRIAYDVAVTVYRTVEAYDHEEAEAFGEGDESETGLSRVELENGWVVYDATSTRDDVQVRLLGEGE